MDTGPLVAYLDEADSAHEWAVQMFERVEPPFLVCDAVLTEACHLLAACPGAHEKIGDYLRRGMLVCTFPLAENHERVFALMARYRNVPMALADACLVCMAEDHRGSRVFTLDSDFAIYRLPGRKALPLLAPGR